MKFAFDEFHLWYQLALSMVACGKVRLKLDKLTGHVFLLNNIFSFSLGCAKSLILYGQTYKAFVIA